MIRLHVIIPAFRGAAVIHRSLDSLIRQRFDRGLRRGEVGVTVAVNDDRDDTFAAAVVFQPRLAEAGLAPNVIRTSSGRAQAMQAADRLTPAGAHRVFLDQDARLSCGGLSALAAALDSPGVHFATLRPDFDPSPSPLVRLHCDGWLKLPYVQRSPVTMGLFAVSAGGRMRWTAWPALVADDKFVRLLFAPAERSLIDAESYTVLPPANWNQLVRGRARYRASNRQLRQSGHRDAVPRHGGLLRSAADPRNWPGLAVIVTTEAAALVIGLRR